MPLDQLLLEHGLSFEDADLISLDSASRLKISGMTMERKYLLLWGWWKAASWLLRTHQREIKAV